MPESSFRAPAAPPPEPPSAGDAAFRPPPPVTWRDRVQSLCDALAVTPAQLAVRAGAAVVVVAVGAVVLLSWRRQPPPPELQLPVAGAETTSSTAPTTVQVHAAGAVARPGLYRIAATARVAELLEAAGGPTGDADLDQVNLAAKVADGERVYVPRRGEAPPPGAAGSGAGAGGLVDLNTATLEQLDALPGIGPATAQAILDERARRGRFRRVEDLLDVRGIGEAKLAELRKRVRV